MYFSPTVCRRTDQSLVSTVAHEVAHVMLGQQTVARGLRADREAGADDLARQWGFHRRYTQRYLELLRRHEGWLVREHAGEVRGRRPRP